MDSTLESWLSSVGTQVFAWSAVLFLAINGAAAVTFLLNRDRGLVNRWTSRILAVDLLLLGAGIGVPLVTSLTRLTVSVVSTSMTSFDGVAKAEMTPLR